MDSSTTLTTVDQLIDTQHKTWNITLLESVIALADVSLILSIPFSRTHRPDSLGWFPTKSGKYTVKSGYHLEREPVYNDDTAYILEPSIKKLQAFSWKVKCPSKIRHFIWQALSGCLPVAKNLNGRGIKCDTRCLRCGVEEESINHVLFECPPAIQTWALSNIPTNPEFFPTSAIYTNMDYLFWRLPSHAEMHIFPWIMWYFWKSRNDMVFSHIDRGPPETLSLAAKEFATWGEAQLSEVKEPTTRIPDMGMVENGWTPTGQWCFVDGSWKQGDMFSGHGWISGYERDANIMMGAMNIRSSLSSLHAEFEALIWAMECMKQLRYQHITFATDCSELVKIVSEPEEWPAFSIHLDEFKTRKDYFSTFELIHVSRTINLTADRLARSARLRSSHSVHVGPGPPSWISEK